MEGPMGELIEHADEGGNVVRVNGERGESIVPVKVYQDVYHQITGRTEEIRKRYSENILVTFDEIEQLHHKLKQICDVHNIVASNEVVTVFHEKERKEQFTSFERFRAYNANAASPTVSVVLKYNFSILLPGLTRPQGYAGKPAATEELLRFAVVYVGGFHILMWLAWSTFKTLEESIDSYTEISYLSLNKGDKNLIDAFWKNNWRVYAKSGISVLGAIAIGILSNKLSNLV